MRGLLRSSWGLRSPASPGEAGAGLGYRAVVHSLPALLLQLDLPFIYAGFFLITGGVMIAGGIIRRRKRIQAQ